jgi:myosin heavy subunit
MPEQKKWSGNMVENCKTLIKHLKQTTTDVQIGTSRVLYRAPQHRAMELIRNVAVERSTIYLQGWIRSWCAQWLLKRMKKVAQAMRLLVMWRVELSLSGRD